MNQILDNKNKIKQKVESLEKESQAIQALLNEELDQTKDKIVNLSKIALGIGGGLLFSTIILRSFFKRGNTSPGQTGGRVYQRFKHQLLGELSVHATNLLLGIARDKLDSYKRKQENAENQDSDLTD